MTLPHTGVAAADQQEMTQTLRRLGVSGLLLFLAVVPAARADNVVPDDQVIQGSICAGLDCVDGESFGFDTLRLKENNTALTFDDTSVTAGFPANDWTLKANDTSSGGRNVFMLNDVTNNKTPVAIMANAPTNALFVDAGGKVGLGTDTPALELSLRTNDTPAVRMEQTNGGGFTAQTWDVAGNEANFFVRDVTGGSRLPFRIRPLAPTSSLDISATGDVSTVGMLLQHVDHLTITGPTNGAAILAALRGLTLSRYTRDNDSAAAPHVGPTGAAFRAAFGTGNSDDLLAAADTAGIALAAVKALDARVSALPSGPKGADGAPGAGVADPRVGALVTSNRKLGTANRRLARHLAALKKQVKALAAAQR
jgi:hypothetical protein